MKTTISIEKDTKERFDEAKRRHRLMSDDFMIYLLDVAEELEHQRAIERESLESRVARLEKAFKLL